MIIISIWLFICLKFAFVTSGSLDPSVASDTLQAGGFAAITYSAVTERRRVSAHLLRAESRCRSLASLAESKFGFAAPDAEWSEPMMRPPVLFPPTRRPTGAQQVDRLGRSTDGFPKLAAAEAIKRSAGAKCFSYGGWGVALGSVISTCCCLTPLNFYFWLLSTCEHMLTRT